MALYLKLCALVSSWQYTYDYENRLTGAAKNRVTVQNDTYDNDGNRVEQISGNRNHLRMKRNLFFHGIYTPGSGHSTHA